MDDGGTRERVQAVSAGAVNHGRVRDPLRDEGAEYARRLQAAGTE